MFPGCQVTVLTTLTFNSPLPVNPPPTNPHTTQAVEKIDHPSSTVWPDTPVPLFPHPQFPPFCKSQLTSPARSLVIFLPMVSTHQFRGNKRKQISLLCGIKPGLQRWELDFISTMLSFTAMYRTPDLTYLY